MIALDVFAVMDLIKILTGIAGLFILINLALLIWYLMARKKKSLGPLLISAGFTLLPVTVLLAAGGNESEIGILLAVPAVLSLLLPLLLRPKS